MKIFENHLNSLLINRPILKKVVSNSGWLFIEKLFRYGLALITGILIARHLGPMEYGILSYAVAYSAIFYVLSGLGLDGVVVQELLNNKNKIKKSLILTTAFFLKLSSSITAIILAYICAFVLLNNNYQKEIIVLVIVASLIFHPFELTDGLFQSELNIRPVALARVCAFIVSAVTKIILILLSAKLIFFALAIVFESILVAIGLMIILYNNFPNFLRLRFRRRIAAGMIAVAWPVLLSSICVAITMQIDKIMLGYMYSSYEVGIYSAANQLSNFWNIIPVILGATLIPIITRVFGKNKVDYYQKLQRIYFLLTCLSLSTAILVTFTSDQLINSIFGKDYFVAGKILAIHIWSGIFIFNVSIRSRVLLIESKHNFIAIFAFLTLISNLILNWLLIPAYGGIGAAYASLISWFLCAAIFPLVWKATRIHAHMFFKSLIPMRIL